MKLILLLALCAFAAAAPNFEQQDVQSLEPINPSQRNILVNILISQLINFIRDLIKNGLDIVGIPPLDPLKIEHLHLEVPTGLINLELELKNAELIGLGGFVVNRSHLDLTELSFDLDVSIPRLEIRTDFYDFTGDLFTAIPIYGLGKAEFLVENFNLRAKLFLKQSDSGKSVIIDRIEGARFALPSLKSSMYGAIGGGDIDHIVNAIIEEVLVGYVHRFQGAISAIGARAVISIGNPILEELDTWRFIAPLLPKA